MKIIIYYIMINILEIKNLTVLAKLSGINKRNDEILSLIKEKDWLKKFA